MSTAEQAKKDAQVEVERMQAGRDHVVGSLIMHGNAAAVMAKMLEAQRAVETLKQEGWNAFHKYSYVSDAQVMDAARKAVNDAGLATFVSVSATVVTPMETKQGAGSLNTRAFLDVAFADPDTGGMIVVRWEGEAEDTQDKATNKAIVGGLKYCLLKALLIPTERSDDSDGQEGTQRSGSSGGSRGSQSGGGGSALATDAQKGFLIRLLKEAKAIEHGKDLLAWLTQEHEITDPAGLTKAKASAIIEAIKDGPGVNALKEQNKSKDDGGDKKDETGKHWIDTNPTRFWATVNKAGLSPQEAKEALSVEDIHDFDGDLETAIALIEAAAAK